MVIIDARQKDPEYLRGYLYKEDVIISHWSSISKESLDYLVNSIIRPQRCNIFLATPLIEALI